MGKFKPHEEYLSCHRSQTQSRPIECQTETAGEGAALCCGTKYHVSGDEDSGSSYGYNIRNSTGI